MTSQTLAHLFQLCLARRSLDQIALNTISINCAKLDIDEQIEAAAHIAHVPVDFVWQMFDQTGLHIKGIVNGATVEEVHAYAH